MRINGLVVLWFAVLLAACGGGGGGGGGGSSGTGGGTGGGDGDGAAVYAEPVSGANVVGLVVDRGPTGKYVNGLFTTVTICQPNSSVCQDIDHVLVDTGSYGLRLMAEVVTLNLPQQNNGSGVPLAECAQFVSGYTWGGVHLADVTLGGERAASLPIQIIGDTRYPTVPVSCASSGGSLNSVQAFGVNGILGVGTGQEDCPSCATSAVPGAYYACAQGGSCSQTTVPLSLQVKNPIAAFAVNNNGSFIRLPAVPASGSIQAYGYLVFGIGTQSNNALGQARVLTTSEYGIFTTSYKNGIYPASFIDSGSNGLFFDDPTIPVCSGWYCPNNTLNLSATNVGLNGVGNDVAFSVANPYQMPLESYAAFANLAGTFGTGQSFGWGLPFFFGRDVFTAINGKSTPAGNGPYVAY